MGRNATITLGVITMIALIIAIDVLFLRDHFWWRLLVNVSIVAAFAALYFAFRARL